MTLGAQIPKGTIIKIAPLNSGDRVFPEDTVLTLGANAAAAATTMTISISPAITKTIKAPFFIQFTDSAGNEDCVKVTSDLDPEDTTITVTALKRAIASGATAPFPPRFKKRESISITPDDTQQDTNTLDDNGWKDSITTMLGAKVSLPGYYSPLDAGWKTVQYCRENLKEMYLYIEMPPPQAHFTKGEIYKGFVGTEGVPVETGSVADVIKSNINFTFRGAPTRIDPA